MKRMLLAGVAIVCFGAMGVSFAAIPVQQGIHKIQHVVVIMQENRTFDEYFGTYPGANGLPVDSNGNFTSCIPDSLTGTCVKPFHDSRDINGGGPHGAKDATADIDNGKMDGFINEAKGNHDVMGFKHVPTSQTIGRMRITSRSTTTCSSRLHHGAFPRICISSPGGPLRARAPMTQ